MTASLVNWQGVTVTEVLVKSDRVSARDKALLKSNSMSAINGVVERHWSLVAAALFPECLCVSRFPDLDEGGLLYGKLSQRVHNPILNVIFLPEEYEPGVWSYVAKMFGGTIQRVDTQRARLGYARHHWRDTSSD